MKDLSNLTNLSQGLTAGESESSGNTVTNDKTNFSQKAPGSMPVNALPEWTDEPQLEIPSSQSKPTTVVHPGSAIPRTGAWKKAGE